MESSSACDRIVLNVGGRIFETSKGTLMMSGSGYFHAKFTTGETMLSYKRGRFETETESIFLDRDGTLFDDVLYFMRTGDLRTKTKLTASTLEDLKVEATYYIYDDLIDACQKALNDMTPPTVKPPRFHGLVVSATQAKRLHVPEGSILYIAAATLAGRCVVNRYRNDPPNNFDLNNPGCYLNTWHKEDTGDFQLFISTTGAHNIDNHVIAHVGMDHVHVAKLPINFDFRHELRLCVAPTSSENRVLVGALGSGEWHVSCWIGRPEDIPGLNMSSNGARAHNTATANATAATTANANFASATGNNDGQCVQS